MRDFIIRENRLSEKERRNLSILDSIRKGGEISRAEISKLTDLNIVTVSNYVSKYIKSKIVFETGLDISSGGRRPELLTLNSGYGYSIGIDLGSPHVMNDSYMVSVLTDLSGKVIAREEIKKEIESFDKMTEKVLTMTQTLVKNANIKISDIKGIGVGIWGVIDRYRGLVRYATEKEDIVSYTNLLDKLESRFGVSTVIEHDATLAAFGENWSGIGVGSSSENLVFLCGDSSCGIILKGEVYYGASKSAGELNINPPHNAEPKEKDRCWSDYDYGCVLRSRGIDLGTTARLKSYLEEHSEERSMAVEMVNGDLDDLCYSVIAEAAEKGDQLSIKILEDAGNYLGVKISFLINLFNPEVIIVGRGVEKAWDSIFPAIRNSVRKWGYDESVKVAKILPTSLGTDVVAIGASALVVKNIFENV